MSLQSFLPWAADLRLVPDSLDCLFSSGNGVYSLSLRSNSYKQIRLHSSPVLGYSFERTGPWLASVDQGPNSEVLIGNLKTENRSFRLRLTNPEALKSAVVRINAQKEEIYLLLETSDGHKEIVIVGLAMSSPSQVFRSRTQASIQDIRLLWWDAFRSDLLLLTPSGVQRVSFFNHSHRLEPVWKQHVASATRVEVVWGLQMILVGWGESPDSQELSIFSFEGAVVRKVARDQLGKFFCSARGGRLWVLKDSQLSLIRLIDFQSEWTTNFGPKKLRVLDCPDDSVRILCSSDGSDESIFVYDAEERRKVFEGRALGSRRITMQFSGSRVLVLSANLGVEAIDLPGGAGRSGGSAALGRTESLRADFGRFVGEGEGWVLAGSGSSLILFDTHLSAVVQRVDLGEPCIDIAVQAGGRRAVVRTTGRLLAFNWEEEMVLGAEVRVGRAGKIRKVGLADNKAAICEEDRGVAVVDWKDGRLRRTALAEEVEDFELHPSGKYAMILGRGGRLSFIDLASGDTALVLPLGMGAVRVRTDAVGLAVIVARQGLGPRDSVEVWSVASGRKVAEFQATGRVEEVEPSEGRLTYLAFRDPLGAVTVCAVAEEAQRALYPDQILPHFWRMTQIFSCEALGGIAEPEKQGMDGLRQRAGMEMEELRPLMPGLRPSALGAEMVCLSRPPDLGDFSDFGELIRADPPDIDV